MKSKLSSRQLMRGVSRRKVLMNRVDRRVSSFMEHAGHALERYLLGGLFVWLGALKVFGHATGSSMIAKSVYWFDPKVMVPVLGVWEVVIGLGLLIVPLHRLSILLLIIRFPGTVLALIYHYDTCFPAGILTPSLLGQYLLKDLTIIGAALVIGGTVRSERRRFIAE